ncbi:hypothetical protein JTB14_016417 [Gonioctena quinquepunctata]|nr:hypothetical protein JTB14_016417 [Gonioctena quinquepunctata]
MNSRIKIAIGQINLQKSRTATLEIRQVAEDLRLDVLLVQEPYAYEDRDKKWRIPGFASYRIAADTTNRPLAGIIIMNKGADAMQLKLTNKHPAYRGNYVQVTQGSNVLTNQYILESRQGHGPYDRGGGDFNAKSELWYANSQCNRGLAMEGLLLSTGLHLMNLPNQPETFSTANGVANNDLTLADMNTVSTPYVWKVLPDKVQSDDRLIITKVGSEESSKGPQNQNEYSMKHLNLDMINQIGPWYEEEFASRTVETEADIDSAITDLTTALLEITECAAKKMRWVARARRQHQRARRLNLPEEIRDNTKRAFQQELKAYKRALRGAREESWTKFVSEDLAPNPWGYTYKLAAAKIKTTPMAMAVEDPQDKDTTSMIDTLKAIADKPMPEDEIQTDSGANTEWRQEAADLEGVDIPDLDLTITVADIHAKILACALPFVEHFLTKIFNGCLTLGIFPKQWKIGKLVTILKGAGKDPSRLDSWRPLTLLSELGKMLERIIISKIMKSIPNDQLISRNHFGFTQSRSTIGAIKNVLTHIEQDVRHHLVIFIDIKGAFNNMWWPGLIKYVHDAGLPKLIVKLIKSYLSERKVEYYSLHEKVEKTLSKGCPQGSALGPLLWNHY